MPVPEFISLPDGRTQVRLSTGTAKGGAVATVLGLVALGIAAATYFNRAAWCFPVGCGGVGALMLLGGLWAIYKAVIVGGRLGDATLTFSHYPLRLGQRFEVAYEQGVRRTHDIESVRLTLKCEEVARYRVGTDTRTVKHTALERAETLLESGTASPDAPLAATALFEIPAAAMHSFNQTNNKIIWTLKLKTDIAKLPDYDAECKLEVVASLAPEAGGSLALGLPGARAAGSDVDAEEQEDEDDEDEDDADVDESGA